jgi:Protein of unknown function (DUF3558)
MRPSAVVLAVLCLGLAGCTGPSAEPMPDVISTADRPTEAPPVTKTVDLSRHEGKPCELLPSAQQASLGLPERTYQGPFTCEFEQAQPHVKLTFQVLQTSDVLGRAYLESNEQKWQRFEPLTIDGLPAVVHSFDPPGPHTTCEVVVGTGTEQGLTVNASGSDTSVDWCGKAQAAAGFILGQ